MPQLVKEALSELELPYLQVGGRDATRSLIVCVCISVCLCVRGGWVGDFVSAVACVHGHDYAYVRANTRVHPSFPAVCVDAGGPRATPGQQRSGRLAARQGCDGMLCSAWRPAGDCQPRFPQAAAAAGEARPLPGV